MMFQFGKKKTNKAAWAKAVFDKPPAHPEKISESDLARITKELIFQDLRIINESIDIAQETGNLDTREGRIALAKKHYQHLQTLAPYADEDSKALIRAAEKHIKALDFLF